MAESAENEHERHFCLRCGSLFMPDRWRPSICEKCAPVTFYDVLSKPIAEIDNQQFIELYETLTVSNGNYKRLIAEFRTPSFVRVLFLFSTLFISLVAGAVANVLFVGSEELSLILDGLFLIHFFSIALQFAFFVFGRSFRIIHRQIFQEKNKAEQDDSSTNITWNAIQLQFVLYLFFGGIAMAISILVYFTTGLLPPIIQTLIVVLPCLFLVPYTVSVLVAILAQNTFAVNEDRSVSRLGFRFFAIFNWRLFVKLGVRTVSHQLKIVEESIQDKSEKRRAFLCGEIIYAPFLLLFLCYNELTKGEYFRSLLQQAESSD